MGVRDSFHLDHAHPRRVHCQAISGCMSPFSFCIIKSIFFHTQRKKIQNKRNKTMLVSSVQTLCSLLYLKDSCVLQKLSLHFNVSENTLSSLCPNSSYLHIQRVGNPHAIPPNGYRDTKKNTITFCILHSWKYRDYQGGLNVLLQKRERFMDL